MRKIIYYVASSVDGYISGDQEDVSAFAHEGPCVDQYQKDLESFDTVIMGRKTYEFGYQYGLKPGQAAYPHMDNYVFSNQLKFDDGQEKVLVRPLEVDVVRTLKHQERRSDIYLCGGGDFAGWLLQRGLIDEVKLKLNPFILGTGVKLFGDVKVDSKLKLREHQIFEDGLQLVTYHVNN